MSSYGKRADATEKGKGFYGEIPSTDGKSFSTELGANMTVDGKDVHFPLIHPGLSKQELQDLADGKKPSRDLVNRALDHAMKRKAEGKSPFAEDGEQQPLPNDEEEFDKGFKSK